MAYTDSPASPLLPSFSSSTPRPSSDSLLPFTTEPISSPSSSTLFIQIAKAVLYLIVTSGLILLSMFLIFLFDQPPDTIGRKILVWGIVAVWLCLDGLMIWLTACAVWRVGGLWGVVGVVVFCGLWTAIFG